MIYIIYIKDNLIYEINEDCMQGRICCPCLKYIKSIEKIEHKIFNAVANHVGSIFNINFGCNAVGCCSCRTDKYGINFPDKVYYFILLIIIMKITKLNKN